MVKQDDKTWHTAVESGDLQKRNLPIKPDVQDYKSLALKKEIGKRINYLLKIYNLTQTELAEQLGTSAPYLNRVISGGALIGTELLARLGDVMDVNIDWILTGKGQFERTPKEIMPLNIYNTTLMYSILAKAVADGNEEALFLARRLMGNDFLTILGKHTSYNDDVKQDELSNGSFLKYIRDYSKLPSLTQEVYNSTHHIDDGNMRCKAVFESALAKWLDNYESPIVSEFCSGMMQRHNMRPV